ncbi:MAG: hypothetical protein ACRD2A_26935 [Vicinamibacterales bacterium]
MPGADTRLYPEPHNEQLLLAAPLSVAAGSLRSPAAFIIVAPQQNCGRWADYRGVCVTNTKQRLPNTPSLAGERPGEAYQFVFECRPTQVCHKAHRI